MWAAKQVRLHGMGGDSSHVHGSSHDEAGPSTSRPAVAPEPEGPHQSDSETTEIPMAEAPNPTQISMMRRPKAFLMTGSLVCLPCRGKR